MSGGNDRVVGTLTACDLVKMPNNEGVSGGLYAIAQGGDGTLVTKSPLVCLMDQGGSVMNFEKGKTGTLRAQEHGHAPIVAADEMSVRRLMPIECERLQGMPDDWTRIPYRGKPAEECPDSPRYKAIGNSWAVPVIQWIGRRIDAAVKEQKND